MKSTTSCALTLQLVVGRRSYVNYTHDTLACGHTIADYDHRTPKRRRCPGHDGDNYSLRSVGRVVEKP